jgi:hypothetical protein
MSAQLFGIIMASLMLAAGLFAFFGGRALLRDGRERRRYRALVGEDQAREAALRSEREDLEVQMAMSGLDDELRALLSE